MKERKFIRFVCNTANHVSGEKIKAVNIVTKVYTDKDEFLYVRKPHITNLENQIIIDIAGFNYKQYLPLHHFKHDGGKIIKKSASEIKSIDKKIKKDREERMVLIEKDKKEIKDNESIIDDNANSDKVKLNALIKLYRGSK